MGKMMEAPFIISKCYETMCVYYETVTVCWDNGSASFGSGKRIWGRMGRGQRVIYTFKEHLGNCENVVKWSWRWNAKEASTTARFRLFLSREPKEDKEDEEQGQGEVYTCKSTGVCFLVLSVYCSWELASQKSSGLTKSWPYALPHAFLAEELLTRDEVWSMR